VSFFLRQLGESFFWRVKLVFHSMQAISCFSLWMDPPHPKPVRAAALRLAMFRGLNAALAFVLLLSMAADVALAQRPATDFSSVATTAVEQHFESLEDYRPGDLVTRSEVAQALANVSDAGAEVADAKRTVELALADDSFLAKELSTPAGRKFMRKVSRHAGGYSHLDRLSSISRGQTIIRDLIRGPDGDKFVEYLATTRGGRNLGSTLAGARQGADLNKPTGRIYTAEDLVTELKRTFGETAGTSQDKRKHALRPAPRQVMSPPVHGY
jgi:hypothetical protein